MAIVWVCGLTVDEYASAGRAVVVPRPVCPACSTAMVFRSGYERPVRQRGPIRKLWLRRARCRRCRSSHALVPSFCLLGRLDTVETIGSALAVVVVGGRWRSAGGGGGRRAPQHRPGLGATLRAPGPSRPAAAFAAVVVELSGVAPTTLRTSAAGQALAMMADAFGVAWARAGPSLPALWGVVAVVTGGGPAGHDHQSALDRLGRRRLIVPVP